MLPFSDRNPSSLGDHLSPILALPAVLYLFWDDVRALLIFQSLSLALGALPIYWLARLRLGTGWAATGLGAAYLLFPTFGQAALFDYHPETLLAFLLPLAFYSSYTGRPRLFLFATAALLLVKEDVALTVFMLGLYACMRNRWRLFGPALSLVSLGWFFAAIYLIIPHFRGEPYLYLGRYAHLGASTWEIAWALATHPGPVLALLGQPDRLAYLQALF